MRKEDVILRMKRMLEESAPPGREFVHDFIRSFVSGKAPLADGTAEYFCYSDFFDVVTSDFSGLLRIMAEGRAETGWYKLIETICEQRTEPGKYAEGLKQAFVRKANPKDVDRMLEESRNAYEFLKRCEKHIGNTGVLEDGLPLEKEKQEMQAEIGRLEEELGALRKAHAALEKKYRVDMELEEGKRSLQKKRVDAINGLYLNTRREADDAMRRIREMGAKEKELAASVQEKDKRIADSQAEIDSLYEALADAEEKMEGIRSQTTQTTTILQAPSAEESRELTAMAGKEGKFGRKAEDGMEPIGEAAESDEMEPAKEAASVERESANEADFGEMESSDKMDPVETGRTERTIEDLPPETQKTEILKKLVEYRYNKKNTYRIRRMMGGSGRSLTEVYDFVAGNPSPSETEMRNFCDLEDAG